MRRSLLAAATAALLLLLVPSGAPAATKATECRGETDDITAASLADAERTLLCMVNVYRAANGLGLLTEDPALMRAAHKYSGTQEDAGAVGHFVGGTTPTQRAEAEGFQCGGFDCVGENAMRANFPYLTPAEAMQGWKDSPGHNANMLEPGYVTAGMGFALGPNNGVTGTQNFATVDNGATGTAADMLTSAACEGAKQRVSGAEAKVQRAKAKVQKADGGKEKRRAKAKLRRAKKKLKSARSTAATACDLTY